MEILDIEIEGDARDDYRAHQEEEQADQLTQVLEDLTGSDLGLVAPFLSIPTLQRMVYDVVGDNDDDRIKAIINETCPNLDHETFQARANQAIEVYHEIKRIMAM